MKEFVAPTDEEILARNFVKYVGTSGVTFMVPNGCIVDGTISPSLGRIYWTGTSSRVSIMDAPSMPTFSKALMAEWSAIEKDTIEAYAKVGYGEEDKTMRVAREAACLT